MICVNECVWIIHPQEKCVLYIWKLGQHVLICDHRSACAGSVIDYFETNVS